MILIFGHGENFSSGTRFIDFRRTELRFKIKFGISEFRNVVNKVLIQNLLALMDAHVFTV